MKKNGSVKISENVTRYGIYTEHSRKREIERESINGIRETTK